MNSYLEELYAHQEWADAEHWRTFEAHSAALEDKAIRERLLHIHMVEHAFRWVTGPRMEQFAFKKIEDFTRMADLKNYAQRANAGMVELVKATSESRFEEIIEIPWFTPPVKISVRQALLQGAMHSHYHRAQNATRLKELGATPPLTDYIVWLRDGKPAPRWQ